MRGNFLGERMGKFASEDVYAFCGTDFAECVEKQQAPKLIQQVYALKNGYKAFCVPGGLIPAEWLAYRGAVGTALFLEVIIRLLWIPVEVIFVLLDKAFLVELHWLLILGTLLWLVFYCTMGFISMWLYYRYLIRNLKKRKLENRENEPCSELKESLKKQGKPSVWRAVLFRVFFLILWICVEDIFNTIIFNLI